VRPTTDDAFALVLPDVNANTLDIFLDRFAACLAQNTHAIVLLDQAGCHGEKALAVPVGGAIHSIKSVRFLFLISCLEPEFLTSCLEPREVVEKQCSSTFPWPSEAQG
jgi:hypothetical protein